MVVILVHWLIRKGSEKAFVDRWYKMTVDSGSGLYREILTTLSPEPEDLKFHTFSIGDPFYSTYINIGMWESVDHFDKAIGKYIPTPVVVEKEGRKIYSIELEEFEFKLRERVVLDVVSDRGGSIPETSLAE